MKIDRASLVLACLVALGPGFAPAATPVPECDMARSLVDKLPAWKQVAPGLEYAHLEIKSDNLNDLTLVRYSNKAYRARVFDLRDVVALNHSRRLYAPPLFALSDLRRNTASAVLISSAGFTRSFSDPIPAGFLRINGMIRSPTATNDLVVNGVVCLGQDGSPSILSDVDSGRRRAPKDPPQCHSGVQAGPVLVADGVPILPSPLRHSFWVVFATTSDNSTIFAFSPSASGVSMACSLSSPRIGATTAIRLQSHNIGGVSLGPKFGSITPHLALGNIEATIASALVVESRGADTLRMPFPFQRAQQ